MDATIHRRIGGAKYGKHRNKVLIHNFFDLDQKPVSLSPSSTKLPISPSSPSTEQYKQDEFTLRSLSPSVSVRPTHITSPSPSPHAHGDVLRSLSPTGQDSISTSRNDVSMFDILSSDEEKDEAASRTGKKRKLSHISKDARTEAPKLKPATKKPTATRQALMEKQHSKIVSVPKPSPDTVRSPAKVTKIQKVETSEAVDKHKQKHPKTAQVELGKNMPALKRKTYGKKTTREALVDIEAPVSLEEEEGMIIFGAEPTVKPSSNVQNPSHTMFKNTPDKDSIPIFDSDTSAASPGQLKLVDLQPSTERDTTTTGIPLVSARSNLRDRQRLVDRLDAPREASNRSKSSVASTQQRTESKSQTSQEATQSLSTMPTFNRSSSSRTRPMYGRARSTYAKERSHLADMVDDLDALSTASSQEASQQIASQLAAATQPSQLQMELDLESDSTDDATGVGKLKSIHELRQAGSNNRFDRDLEALMEDIDPASKSASKGLRLQALMKLLKMTAHDDFINSISGTALDRLASWCSATRDDTSKLLLNIVLWRLTHSKNTSTAKLKRIAETMLASSKMLTSLTTMSRLVKDRKENMASSMIKDLRDFEIYVISENLLPSYEGENVLSASVVVGALNDSLRRLLEMGTMHISVGKQFYKHAFTLLKLTSQSMDEHAEYRFVTKSTLSVLEICTGPFEERVGASSDENQMLGQNLAHIINSCLDKHEDLVQSVLRFAISYCNNRPDVCLSFTNSEFVQSCMVIVDTRFVNLVNDAEEGKHVEQAMLDSIILSLACLLNLAEHEDDLRRKIAHGTLRDFSENSLQRLVAIYKSAAPRLVETTSDGHGQVLVAFGYLSLLICSLSLARDVRKEVDLLLGKMTIDDVVASGRELLMHLRTLDILQNIEGGNESEGTGEVAVDGFTQRFGQILAAVRGG